MHRILLTLPILFGILFASCGDSRRKYVTTQASTSSIETSAVENPPEPTEGKLITGHFAAKGLKGTMVEEPYAPSGQWVPARWGWMWRPDYLLPYPDIFASIVDEINITEAKWEVDAMFPVVPGLGPNPKTRIVVLPGPSFASGKLLVAGLYYKEIWLEDDGSYSDVIFVGLTDSHTRALAPVGHAYDLYAPGTGHELAHQKTGIRH